MTPESAKAVAQAASASAAAASAPLATFALSDVNHVVSIIVGVLSSIFILLQIIKVRRELRRNKERDYASWRTTT